MEPGHESTARRTSRRIPRLSSCLDPHGHARGWAKRHTLLQFGHKARAQAEAHTSQKCSQDHHSLRQSKAHPNANPWAGAKGQIGFDCLGSKSIRVKGVRLIPETSPRRQLLVRWTDLCKPMTVCN